MGIFLLFVTLVAFVLFFYGIGLWYLGFLPFVFFLILLGYYTSMLSIRINSKKILEKYGIFVSWVIILFGLGGVLHFLGLGTGPLAVGLIGINLVLWVLSYFFNYDDGKQTFKLGYYLLVIFLVGYSTLVLSLQGVVKIITILWATELGVSSFLVFILGIWKPIEKSLYYKIFFLTIGILILIVFHMITDTYIALGISILLLLGIFFGIRQVIQRKPLTDNQKVDISLRRVLAGDRITGPKKHFKTNFYISVYNFFSHIPKWTKYLLEVLNILLIVTLVGVYISELSAVISQLHQGIFRLIIIVFTSNVFLLKKIGYTSTIQRLVVFGVVNFAIYVSLFSYFGTNFGSLALWGVIRNIFSSLLIFSIPKTRFRALLQKRDYIYRIVNIMMAMFINIVLLSKSNTEGQLIFSLIFLYLGLQGMLLFYAIKYINKMERHPLSMEEIELFLQKEGL